MRRPGPALSAPSWQAAVTAQLCCRWLSASPLARPWRLAPGRRCTPSSSRRLLGTGQAPPAGPALPRPTQALQLLALPALTQVPSSSLLASQAARSRRGQGWMPHPLLRQPSPSCRGHCPASCSRCIALRKSRRRRHHFPRISRWPGLQLGLRAALRMQTRRWLPGCRLRRCMLSGPSVPTVCSRCASLLAARVCRSRRPGAGKDRGSSPQAGARFRHCCSAARRRGNGEWQAAWHCSPCLVSWVPCQPVQPAGPNKTMAAHAHAVDVHQPSPSHAKGRSAVCQQRPKHGAGVLAKRARLSSPEMDRSRAGYPAAGCRRLFGREGWPAMACARCAACALWSTPSYKPQKKTMAAQAHGLRGAVVA